MELSNMQIGGLVVLVLLVLWAVCSRKRSMAAASKPMPAAAAPAAATNAPPTQVAMPPGDAAKSSFLPFMGMTDQAGPSLTQTLMRAASLRS